VVSGPAVVVERVFHGPRPRFRPSGALRGTCLFCPPTPTLGATRPNLFSHPVRLVGGEQFNFTPMRRWRQRADSAILGSLSTHCKYRR